ncbi:GDSL-type esterase/lipase family protein [Maribacter algicola]|uniref:GDSL-type esterase/lipase family protein n=1 Tax=Meishania litoralis TaxID=3434685 RepID=A0ACC7LK70_9FLAO
MNRRRFIARSAMATLGIMASGCIREQKVKLQKNQVIGCFGDSITAMGNGYVQMLQTEYDSLYPDLKLRFLNYGKSSETVTGLTEEIHPGPRPYLFERLDAELDKEPIDFATFCYGINCGIYGKPSQELFDSFKIGVYTFLEKIKQRQIKAILLTPPPLALDIVQKASPENDSQPYGYLNPYPEYDKEVLQEFKRIVMNIDHPSCMAKIDIRTPLYEKRANCYDEDPIHPNTEGHRLIAKTVRESISVQRT